MNLPVIVAILGAAQTTAGLPPGKNWRPPAKKIYAQSLSDQIMTAHPELISVTFHGAPPGLDRVHTMFAGSFPDRIGNVDSPDDVFVITEGVTILDPCWRCKAQGKFVVTLPLRDASGENVGALVLAYRNPDGSKRVDNDYLLAATALRDGLQPKIPTYAALFERVR